MLLVLGLAIFWFVSQTPKVVLKSFLLSTEVIPNFPLRPLTVFGSIIEQQDVEIDTSIGKIKANIYRPNDNRKHPGMILTLGTIVTKRDAQLVKFSRALSKLGFVVLAADLPDLTAGYVFTQSVDASVDIFKYLYDQPFVDKGKIGFTGFCGGASVVLVAAAQEEVNSQVSFVNTLSPYFDMYDFTRSVLTGTTIDEAGKQKLWSVNAEMKKTFILGYTAYFSDENIRTLLREAILEGKEIDEEALSKLPPEAQNSYRFLKNDNPAQFNQLWETLPQDAKDIVFKLSPSHNLTNLKAKVFILNDLKDTFVPQEESKKLAANLGPDQKLYFEIDSFEHVRPGKKLPRLAAVKQAANLYGYIYSLLSEIS